jgi:hypothetical protein
LNYNRRGIAHQLGLEIKKYSLADLDTLTTVIQNRLNYYADFVSEPQRDSFNKKKRLFSSAREAYVEIEKKYSFLGYHPRSIKPSIYSYLGNYLGFQGYYNPFSGEGQVNTTIPRFLEPFVTTHEMAHQLDMQKRMKPILSVISPAGLMSPMLSGTPLISTCITMPSARSS